MDDQLPELPKPYDGMLSAEGDGVVDGFTADQLRSYAEEAVRLEREAHREIVTLYQHSAMTDDEFVLRMIDLIEPAAP